MYIVVLAHVSAEIHKSGVLFGASAKPWQLANNTPNTAIIRTGFLFQLALSKTVHCFRIPFKLGSEV